MNTSTLKFFLYRHRFFIGSFVVLSTLGFYADLKPLVEQLYAVVEEQEQVTRQLLEKEKAVAQVALISNKFMRVQASATPLLDEVLQQAQLNHLELVVVDTKKNDHEASTSAIQNKEFIIQAELRGMFDDFYHFVAQLYHQGSPLLLNSFALKMQDNALAIAMHYTAFPVVVLLNDEKQTLLNKWQQPVFRDPFQEAQAYSAKLPVLPQTYLQQLKLDELHYIGYLSQGARRSALLLLANGFVEEVYLGSIVGKPAWQVIAVDPGVLTLQAQATRQITHLFRE
jgi:hypothetical protein